jgi:hypothetical protein
VGGFLITVKRPYVQLSSPGKLALACFCRQQTEGLKGGFKEWVDGWMSGFKEWVDGWAEGWV